ncbi:MAG: dTDP-glucose 4,6-dehydratase, partial [Gemmatimonadales bacterium]
MSSGILVTGGAGFIGANFAHYWRRTHPQDSIVVLDALTYAGNRTSLAALEGQPDFTFVHGDIRDQGLVEDLLRDHRLDTLVHFAAESHADRSIHGPDAFVETNIVGTHALLKAARAVWLDDGSGRPHRFHQVSTDEVHGSLGPHDPPVGENAPHRPSSPYAASKAAADHLVRAYHCTYGLEVTTTCCSNNYGPYQFPEKLIPLFTVNALLGEPLPVYGDGRNVRDWLHVDDHCRALDLVLEHGTPGEVYPLGGECEMENLDVVDVLCDAMDAAFEEQPELSRRFPAAPAAHGWRTGFLKTFVADRRGHDRRYAIDNTKVRRELGFESTVDFAQGLRRTLR